MFKRNEKGITLIALVITIIVLLILAGVSIAMLTGGNGLLSKSVQAKIDTYRGEMCDRINTALNAAYSEILANKYGVGEFPTDTQVKESNGMTEAPEHGTWEVTADNKTIVITWNPPEGGDYGEKIVGYIDDTATGTVKYKIHPAKLTGTSEGPSSSSTTEASSSPTDG